MHHRAMACCVTALGIALYASGQKAPTLSTNVKVVNILATVRDKKGQIIPNLNKEGFKLTEDKQPQAIRYFSKQTDIPLTVVLLVDTSLSQERVLPEERKAAAEFFHSNLRTRQDDELIVTFDTLIKLWPEVDTLSVPTDRKSGTPLFDSVYAVCGQKLALKQGRKIMIILSDGVDYGSKVSVDQAIAQAIRGDVVIYSILFSDATFYGGLNAIGPYSPRVGAAVMKGIATGTGGSYLQVSKEHTVEQMFEHIGEDLHNQYSLGFTSDHPAAKTEVRKLNLTTGRPGLLVQARKWYVAQPWAQVLESIRNRVRTLEIVVPLSTPSIVRSFDSASA